jgi:hypothetical protein
MRERAIASVLFGLAFAGLITAQQPASSTTRNANAEITVRGCVSGATRYTFMQASTGAVFALTGNTDHLAQVRGKLVEVTANESAPQPKSGGLPVLRIRDLHVISEKCPIQARAASRATKASPAGQHSPTPKSPATVPYVDPGTATQTPPNVANPNISGDTGTPSPGTGNTPRPPQ